MVGNGSVAYDHDRDGRSTDLGGCVAHIRNVEYDTFLLIRYMKNRLTVRNIQRQMHAYTATPVFHTAKLMLITRERFNLLNLLIK